MRIQNLVVDPWNRSGRRASGSVEKINEIHEGIEELLLTERHGF